MYYSLPISLTQSEAIPMTLTITQLSKTYQMGFGPQKCISDHQSRHVWAPGPNGAGKSSLRYHIHPTRARHRLRTFGDYDVDTEGRDSWATGLLPQEFGVYPK